MWELAPQSASVTGTITTTCDNCVLNAGDITAWKLSGYGSSFTSTVAGSTIFITGDGFVASPKALSFNFNPGSTNDALFSELPGPTPFLGSAESVEFTNSAPLHLYNGIVSLCDTANCYFSPETGNIHVGQRLSAAAPEIDPGTGYAALTLLLGGLAVLRSRRAGRAWRAKIPGSQA